LAYIIRILFALLSASLGEPGHFKGRTISFYETVTWPKKALYIQGNRGFY